MEDIQKGKLQQGHAGWAESLEMERFFNLSIDLLCIADAEGCFRRLNPAWETTMGYPVEELEGRTFMEFVHPDDQAATREALERLLQGVPIFDFINRYRHRDGTYRWIEWRSSPSRENLIYAAARDVTDRVEFERVLKSSEERFRNLVESSPMGIHMYRLDEEGRLVFTGANPAADRILGVDNRQFVGKTIEEAFPPLAETEIPKRYRAACLTGEAWNTEQVQYQDGQIQGAYLVYAFQTAPGSMAVMFLDVTDKRRSEQIREHLEGQLRQAQKMEAVGRLAGGVAHDFNNLLTAILGYCDLALLRLGEQHPVSSDIRHIHDASERAALLTQQLLAFSRKQILQPRVIRLHDAVSELRKMLERIIGEDIVLDLRAGPDAGCVLADPGQLNQVLLNLVVNARDAMPKGGTLTIETSSFFCDDTFVRRHPGMKPGPYALLTVTDDGVGMDEATQTRLFEPFFTTKELGKGTGLGLSTVHGIVTQSGGAISVYSEPGKGSTFRLYFPQVDCRSDGQTQPTGVAPVTGGTETILVAEDAPDVRALACQLLQRLGYRVLEAADAREALEISARMTLPIHLLLTDIVMPGMSGRALADRLTAQRPEIKVLFMSGYAEDSILPHGVADSGIRFIQKPFRSDELARRVREVLDQP